MSKSYTEAVPLFWRDIAIDILLVAVLFIVALLPGTIPASADSTGFYYTARWHFINLFWQYGSLPLWSESLFGGMYTLGNPTTGLLTPTILLYLLISSHWALLVHYFLLALVSVTSLRHLLLGFQFSLLESRVFSLAWICTGVVVSNIQYTPYFTELCLLPLLILLWDRWQLETTLTNTLLLGLGSAWLVAEGGIHLFYVLTGLFLILCVYQAKAKRDLQVLFLGFLVPILAVCINAPIIWAALESVQNTRRSMGVNLDESQLFSFHPKRLLSFFLPSYWGFFPDGSFIGNSLRSEQNNFPGKGFWLDSIYLSLPILLGNVFLFTRKKARELRIAALFIVVLVLLSFGAHFPLFSFFFDTLPFFSGFRFPEKYMSMASAFLFLGGVVGLRQAIQGKDRNQLLILLSVAALLSLVTIFVKYFSISIAPDAWKSAVQINITLLVIWLLISLLLLSQKIVATLSPDRQSLLLACLVLIELVILAPPMNRKQSEDLATSSNLSRSLKEAYPQKNVRVLLDPNVNLYAGHNSWPDRLFYNWGIRLGVNYTLGYNPLLPKRLDDIPFSKFTENFLIWSNILQIDAVLTTMHPREEYLFKLVQEGQLELAAINEEKNIALVRRPNLSPIAEFKRNTLYVASGAIALKEVSSREGNTPLIVEDKTRKDSPISRAKPKEDANAEKAKVTFSKGINSRSIFLESDVDGFLVLREQFSNLWNVAVNGASVPYYRADFLNLAVPVSAGKNQVKLEFRPNSFVWGRWIAFLALVIVLGALAWNKKEQPISWLLHRKSKF